MKTTTQRSSNMELLRILAILMIVAYHISCHTIEPQLADYAGRGNDYFCTPGFSVRMLLLVLVSPMGQAANAIFLLISGYFMMAPEKKIDLTKISKKLLCQLGWATLVLVATSGVMYHIVFRAVSAENVTLIDFYAFNNMSWYVGYYFLILVFAKLFLNRILQAASQKSYLMFLITIFAIVQFVWSRGRLDGLISELSTVFTGIFLHTLGGVCEKIQSICKPSDMELACSPDRSQCDCVCEL